jgi:hypothetical protein
MLDAFFSVRFYGVVIRYFLKIRFIHFIGLEIRNF